MPYDWLKFAEESKVSNSQITLESVTLSHVKVAMILSGFAVASHRGVFSFNPLHFNDNNKHSLNTDMFISVCRFILLTSHESQIMFAARLIKQKLSPLGVFVP